MEPAWMLPVSLARGATKSLRDANAMSSPIISPISPAKASSRSAFTSRQWARFLSAALGLVVMLAASILAGTFAPAQAQIRVSAEFRTALQPYGRWEPHARWGEV